MYEQWDGQTHRQLKSRLHYMYTCSRNRTKTVSANYDKEHIEAVQCTKTEGSGLVTMLLKGFSTAGVSVSIHTYVCTYVSMDSPLLISRQMAVVYQNTSLYSGTLFSGHQWTYHFVQYSKVSLSFSSNGLVSIRTLQLRSVQRLPLNIPIPR